MMSLDSVPSHEHTHSPLGCGGVGVWGWGTGGRIVLSECRQLSVFPFPVAGCQYTMSVCRS